MINGQSDYDIVNQSSMGRAEDDESDDNGAMSGDDDQVGQRIRRYNRHTTQQTQELENFFKECPNPNENQRYELGQRINLEARQIKFWFQNRRTQARALDGYYVCSRTNGSYKTRQCIFVLRTIRSAAYGMHRERRENETLRQEHDRLLGDQEQLKQAMILGFCNICCRPTNFGKVYAEVQHLKAENAKLKQEIEQIYNFLRTPIQLPVGPSQVQRSSSSLISNAPLELDLGGGTSIMNERSMLLNLADAAMSELVMLGQSDSPFWRINSTSRRESLNYEEYKSVFRNGIKPPGYVMEASRETGLVLMTSFALVKTLMDTNKWVGVFAPIVPGASTRKVISSGHGGTRNGSLQLIQTEFQVLSPLVPERHVEFLRYCKLLRKGVWAVVDVTPSEQNPNLLSYGGSTRLPSGLIIEDMANGSSKVTWIEQAEYDESHIHQLYQPLISSGIGLGAKRWLTTLKRHCETLWTFSTINLTRVFPGMFAKGTAEIVKLAQRMTLNYYLGISVSSVSKWERIQVENEGHNMRLMIRKNVNELGELTGIVLSAATSVRFPVSQQTMFDFLNNQSFRNQWDILTYDTSIEDKFHIPKAKNHGNYVSLLQIIGNGMLVLQEIWNDASGALVVYAPVETNSLEEVMRGEDSDFVQLLPSGFSILPDGETDPDNGINKNSGGCLLTFGLQILVSSKPTSQLTQSFVKTVEELLACTISKIKYAFHMET